MWALIFSCLWAASCTKKPVVVTPATGPSTVPYFDESVHPRMNLLSMSTEMPSLDMKSRVDIFYSIEIEKRIEAGKYVVRVPFFHQAASLVRPKSGQSAPGESVGTAAGAGIPLTVQIVADKAVITEGLDAFSKALWNEAQADKTKAKLADYLKNDDMLANLIASGMGFQRAFLAGRPPGVKEWEFQGNPVVSSFAKFESNGKMSIKQTSDAPEEYTFSVPEVKIKKFDAKEGTTLTGTANTSGGLRFNPETGRNEFVLLSVTQGKVKKESDGQEFPADSSNQMLIATILDPKCSVRFLKPDIHPLVMRAFFDLGYRLAYAETKDAATLDYRIAEDKKKEGAGKLTYIFAHGGKKREFPAAFTEGNLLPAIEAFAKGLPDCGKLAEFVAAKSAGSN